jgi:hypothetical protein
MLALTRHTAHYLTQLAEFVVAQSTLAAFDSELTNARGWVFADDVEAGGVPQQTSQRADSPARDARTAGRFAAPAFLATASRFAGGDIVSLTHRPTKRSSRQNQHVRPWKPSLRLAGGFYDRASLYRRHMGVLMAPRRENLDECWNHARSRSTNGRYRTKGIRSLGT